MSEASGQPYNELRPACEAILAKAAPAQLEAIAQLDADPRGATPVVKTATCIIMLREGCEAEQALDLLRRASQQSNRSVLDIAATLVEFADWNPGSWPAAGRRREDS